MVMGGVKKLAGTVAGKASDKVVSGAVSELISGLDNMLKPLIFPIISLTTILGGIGAGFENLTKAIGTISKLVSKFVEPFTNLLMPPLLALITMLSPLVKMVNQMMRPVFQRLMEYTRDNAGSLQDGTMSNNEFMQGYWNTLLVGLGDVFAKMLFNVDLFDTGVDNIANAVNDFDNEVKQLEDDLGNAATATGEFIDSILNPDKGETTPEQQFETPGMSPDLTHEGTLDALGIPPSMRQGSSTSKIDLGQLQSKMMSEYSGMMSMLGDGLVTELKTSIEEAAPRKIDEAADRVLETLYSNLAGDEGYMRVTGGEAPTAEELSAFTKASEFIMDIPEDYAEKWLLARENVSTSSATLKGEIDKVGTEFNNWQSYMSSFNPVSYMKKQIDAKINSMDFDDSRSSSRNGQYQSGY
uniref:Putative tail protein n=2 Tax=viral metagenome TaxID=1070528 RepID=A0A6M3LY89_9ZZZZ